jgi:hypothetical protein
MTLLRGLGVAMTQGAGPRRQRHKEKGRRARRPAASADWAGPIRGARKRRGSGFSCPRDASWAERPKAREERRKRFFYFFFFFSNISKPFSNSF